MHLLVPFQAASADLPRSQADRLLAPAVWDLVGSDDLAGELWRSAQQSHDPSTVGKGSIPFGWVRLIQ